jgi:hypothetical protein
MAKLTHAVMPFDRQRLLANFGSIVCVEIGLALDLAAKDC